MDHSSCSSYSSSYIRLHLCFFEKLVMFVISGLVEGLGLSYSNMSKLCFVFQNLHNTKLFMRDV